MQNRRWYIFLRSSTCYLLASHIVASAVSFMVVITLGTHIIFNLTTHIPFTSAYWRLGFLWPIFIGGLVGFLCTNMLRKKLHTLEYSLQRLTHQQPAPVATSNYPFSTIFALLNQLGQQTGRQRQHEQQTTAYRDQLLTQVEKTAAQEERNRLARDLHDSIKQQIFSISTGAATAQMRWEQDPAGARAALDFIRKNAQEAQVEMQALLQQLRPAPLENVGLKEALRINTFDGYSATTL